jgi:PhoH-like ATPase
MNYHKVYVLDTNILLQDATHLFRLSENGNNLLVIPETVLDEIDMKKSGFDEINFQARAFARIIESGQTQQTERIGDHTIITVTLHHPSTAHLAMITKNSYSSDRTSASNIVNDRKILEIAKFAHEHYDEEVTFLSLDVMARIRATSMDLVAQSLLGVKDDDGAVEFQKRIVISFDASADLNNRSIYEFDPNYKIENVAYEFEVEDADHVILATVQNERIVVLDEAEVRDQIITPMNKEQLFFSHAIIEPYYTILVVEAKAGSGKTLLALSGAMKLVRQKAFKKIVYIRNSIESLDKGEEVGFLPGLEEKFKIYNHPLMDSLDYIVRLDHKRSKSVKNGYVSKSIDEETINIKIAETIKRYAIETMWVGEMRGRTISDAVVIIDEAQNMSNKTMQMVLSRMSESCKVMVLGSNKQIDNFYVNKHTNALTTLLKSVTKKYEGVHMFAVTLKKVLRGPITEWAEAVFSKG